MCPNIQLFRKGIGRNEIVKINNLLYIYLLTISTTRTDTPIVLIAGLENETRREADVQYQS
jgi:hypothetical protein